MINQVDDAVPIGRFLQLYGPPHHHHNRNHGTQKYHVLVPFQVWLQNYNSVIKDEDDVMMMKIMKWIIVEMGKQASWRKG